MAHPILIGVIFEANLMIFIILLTEVQLNGSSFEDTLRFSRCLVNDSRDYKRWGKDESARFRFKGGVVL